MRNKEIAIFADHCVHNAVIKNLRADGWNVKTAAEAGLAAATDEDIFQYVIRTRQLLLTFDSDFGNILRFNPSETAGMIIVYVNNLSKDEMIEIISNFFFTYSPHIANKLYIVEKNQVRVWPRSS